MSCFNLLEKIQAALLIEGETLVMVARLTIICKVGGLIIGVIVSEAFLLNRIYLLFKKMTRKYIAGGFRTGLLLL